MLCERFPGLMALPPEDKRQIIFELWQSLELDPHAADISPETARLIERKIDDYLADPEAIASSEEMWARIAVRHAENRRQREKRVADPKIGRQPVA